MPGVIKNSNMSLYFQNVTSCYMMWLCMAYYGWNILVILKWCLQLFCFDLSSCSISCRWSRSYIVECMTVSKLWESCNTDIAVRWPKSPHRYWNSHAIWDHSVTCHPAEVTFQPLPQPKLLLDLATPEGCKAEYDALFCVCLVTVYILWHDCCNSVFLPRLLAVVEPQRPLRPRRVERKKVPPQNVQQGDVKILTNIVRAFGIPVREQT